MKPLDYLKKYVLKNFKELLKIENDEKELINNNSYQEFSIIDSFKNSFSLNLKKLIKDSVKGAFEINGQSYNKIDSYIIKEINSERFSKKFSSELLTLSSFLKQCNISPINLTKLKSYPDFLVEENQETIYLLEIFNCKDSDDWKYSEEIMKWSISTSEDDLNKLSILCNINDTVNKNLELINSSLNNLELEKLRSHSSIYWWKFNKDEAIKSFDKHMNKISNYRKNYPDIKNLTFLIEMGIYKPIDYNDMIDFSQSILNKIKEKKYNYHGFKIRIILINQTNKYTFYLN